ncbi:hypothetical protein [Rouxiella sp. Mn2063]|uniref:hypothetical protein n=1 Tax=Rouxiella sp. Mn2063 TaxID=3395262 RepID=UPI003BD8996C
MKKIVYVGFFSLVAIAVLASIFSVSNDEAKMASMASICSDITKKSVKSPNSYKLKSLSAVLIKMTQEQKDGVLKSERYEDIKNLIERDNASMMAGKAFIDFEASNSLGVSLKGFSMCEYTVLGDSWIPVDSVTIDDKLLPTSDVLIASSGEKVGSGFLWKARYLLYKATGKI